LAANSDRSIEIPIYTKFKLDEASYKRVNEAIAKTQQAAQITTRADQAIWNRKTSAKVAAQGLNFNDLFQKSVFDLFKNIKKTSMAGAIGREQLSALMGGDLNLALPKFTFNKGDLSGLQDLLHYGDELAEVLRAFNEDVNLISMGTGIKPLEIDISKWLPTEDNLDNLDQGKLLQLLQKQFIQIGDTVIPNLEFLQSAYDNALSQAGRLNVPAIASGKDPRIAMLQMEREDLAQALKAQQELLKELEDAGDEAPAMGGEIEDAIDDATEKILSPFEQAQKAVVENIKVLQNSLNNIDSLIEEAENFKSNPSHLYRGSEGRSFTPNSRNQKTLSEFNAVASQSPEAFDSIIQQQTLYWAKKFFDDTIASLRGSRQESDAVESGSQQIVWWVENFVDKFREKVLSAGFDPGSEIEMAVALRDSLLMEAAGITAAEIAKQRVPTITRSGQFSESEERGSRPLTALEFEESLTKQIGYQQAIALNALIGEIRGKNDPDFGGNFARGNATDKEWEDFKAALARAVSPGFGAVRPISEQMLSNPALMATKGMGEGALKQVEEFTKQALASASPQKLESDFDAWKAEFFERLKKLGKIDTVAFDTEFNDKIDGALTYITEAAVTVKDKMGNLVDIFDMIHVPAQESWETNSKVPFAPKNRAEAEEIAKNAMISGGIGSMDPEQNVREYYGKIQKLLFVLETLGKDAAIIGSNAGQTDLNAVGKVIEYLNKVKSELAPDLPNLVDITPGMLTAEPNRIVNQSKEQVAKVLKSAGASLSAMMTQILEHYSDKLDEEQKKMFRVGDKGLEVKVEGAESDLKRWLPAHYAKVDNRIAIVVKDVLDQLLPVDSSKVRSTKDYTAERFVKRAKESPAVSSGGGSEPPAPVDVVSGESADNLQKTFLAVSQINAIMAEMPEHEKMLANAAIIKLQKQSEYLKLVDKERGLREEIADLEASGASEATVRAKKDELNQQILIGRKLERQTFEKVKADARAGDVAKKYQNTAAMTVDTQIELERATGRAFSNTIQAQVKEQANAVKEVDKQTKSLINTWVTGRYALYDVGNAYAEVSRQLWNASRQIFNITQAYRSYETAFTSVERAIEPLAATLAGSRAEAESLQEAFVNLSEEIPVSFEDITRIATLGAQMGVTASGIVDFTKVVSEFSSVTGVSADTVAQKFGRIAELANVDYSQFANLGSSILYAGINAVATEPEIMTLSESIAAVSAQAGMLPQEIVGMATALASTGIQAEQARGVFTRVFADIDRAVSRGGTELNNFASVAGMSAENFAKAWGTEGASYDVFRAILGGLGATEDLTAAFDSLNIVETREINTLTRLAENLNVVDQAISDANSSFESGAFLGESFGKTVDNLDAQIQMFNNNVKSLTVELSKGLAGSLGFVLEVANGMLQLFKEMAKNRLFTGITGGALAITALGAAGTLAVSAMAKLVAQVYAFRVAAINTANDPKAVSGVKAMLGQLTGFGGGIIEMRDQLKSIEPTARGVLSPMAMNGPDAMADAFGRWGSKVKFLGDSFKRTDRVQSDLLKTQNIFLANSRLEADQISEIIRNRALEIQSIESRTESLRHAYDATVAEQSAINRGEATLESINAARAQERASMLAAIGGRKIYIETVNGEARALTANQYAELQNLAAADRVAGVKNSEYAARLKNVHAIDMETKSAARTSKMQLGLGQVLLGAASGLGAVLAVVTTITTLITGVQAAIEASKVNLLESGGGLASLRDAIKQDTVEYNKLTAAQKASSNEFEVVKIKTRTYTNEVNTNAVAIADATGVAGDFVDKNKQVVEGIEDSTLALGRNTREWFANAAMQDENLNKALEGSPTLFKDVADAGYDLKEIINQIFENPNVTVEELLPGIDKAMADAQSKARQLQDAAISASDPQVSANYQQQADAAFEYARKLQLLKQVVESLQGSLSTAVNKNEVFNAIADALGLTSEAVDETTESVNDLGDALRTVLDYASDLAGILSRIVELEFGKQMSRDTITTGWRDLAESVNDAKEAIEDANNEIKGLTADRDVLQYQLSVAERYGDEVRAAKIRAELAKINKQITDSEKDLAKAKADSSTALTGDSDAAIRNRAELLKMVGTYQSHIETLAKLGMNRSELTDSTEVLKRQFLAEAKALGFSGKQLEDYAALFDNFADVATDAPRDVDIEVKLGLTAAEQAIQEFLSKKRTTSPTVTPNTADADKKGSPLDTFLNKERFFRKPDVTGIESRAADIIMKDWLEKIRYFQPIIADKIDKKGAESEITKLLNQVRIINVQLKISLDKDLLLAQAENIRKLAIANKDNKTAYNSYMDTYRIINGIATRMATGGLVSGPGSGTSDSVPAMLSNGEFVVKASAVKAYGVDFFNALNQQRMGFSPVMPITAGGQQSGPTMVFLSPEDRQLLRQFGDRPVNLYADATKIAEVANNGNTKMSRRGSR